MNVVLNDPLNPLVVQSQGFVPALEAGSCAGASVGNGAGGGDAMNGLGPETRLGGDGDWAETG